MSNLERVSWDSLRSPLPPPPPVPVRERWGRVRNYAEHLESEGTISPLAKQRLLRVFGRLLLYHALIDEITSREQRLNAKIGKYVVRFSRKIR